MRTLTLTAVTAFSMTVPAWAADLGTYRPGQVYHATSVPGAGICESACAGDAQCAGWNYVKPAPQAAGVCELQSTVGAPVSSAISISGLGNASSTALAPNVVRGQTNTVRVGTAPAVAPKTTVSAQPSGRQVHRQPVVRPVTPQAAAHGRPPHRSVQHSGGYPVPQGAPVQRGFQPMLDSRAPAVANRSPRSNPAHVQGRPAVAPRGPARQRDPRLASSRAQVPATRVMPTGRPPIGQPIPPGPRVENARPAMPSRAASQPMTFEQAQASLYGSLHDDVRAPRANTPMPADPNAPIATSQSRPVAPVAVEPLEGAFPR